MQARSRIRVHIADDHPVVVEGLKAVLKSRSPEVQVTGVAADGRQALALARSRPADVYVYDISMPAPDGLEVMATVLSEKPDAKIIILSMHDDRATVRKSLRGGAKGYLVKESAAAEITEALRTVCAGGSYLSRSLASAAEAPDAAGNAALTGREMDVVRLTVDGLSCSRIAKQLGVSASTIAVHRRNVFLKLGVKKQTDLVRYAIRMGLVRP